MLYEKKKKKAYGFVTVVWLFFFYVKISNKSRTKIQSGLSNDSRGCFIFLEKFYFSLKSFQTALIGQNRF